MSARFSELMALSASQTRQSDLATQQLLAEKKRKEEQRKKEQQKKEKKDRELQLKLVQKRLEEQQREEERKRKAEEDRHKREMVLQRREAEQRKNLIYGKERRPGGGSSGGGSSGGGGRSRKAKGSDNDDADGGTQVLTREEKRQRKLNADLNKGSSSTGKGGGHLSGQSPRRPNKPVRTVDSSYSSEPHPTRPLESRSTQPSGSGPAFDSSKSGLSIRQQLASMPTTLIRLNTVKRDRRTIDEIVTDIQKAKESKIIEGDEARGFSDWFHKQKKREASATRKTTSPGSSLSPPPDTTALQSPPLLSKEATSVNKPLPSNTPRATLGIPERKEPRTKVTVIKPELKDSLSFTKVNKVAGSASVKASSSASKPSTLQPFRTTSSVVNTTGSSLKKRGRSYSLSESESGLDSPPCKRRSAASSGRNDISSEIWKLFGKDRDRYMRNDVFSDEDEDMEADADDLRREEIRSARIAKKEDEAALEEEKRHEEEKRRRKKEKEKKGY